MHNVIRKYLSFFVSKSHLDIFTDNDLRFIGDCLKHKEERESSVRDQWGNWDFPYTDAPFNRPYLDEYVLNILANNGIAQKTIWPDGKKFAICISHDVDFVTDTSKDLFFRNLFKRPVSKMDLVKLPYYFAKEQVKELIKNDDRLWVYEKWLEEMKKYNFTSTFFYFSRPDTANLHEYDCDYLFSDIIKFEQKKMTVGDMMKRMDAEGFEVGLHGSYHSYNSPVLLQQQRQKIEQIIDKPVTSIRQHWLHFDIDRTPEVHYRSGLEVDSTLGFNRTIGFRAGTAFPYMLTDNKLNELPVMEVPMHIMDGALFSANSLELNETLAIKRSFELMDKVERVGGCLTINFHPNYIIFPQWWNTFKAILAEASIRNAHCLKMNEFKTLVNNIPE